MMCLWGMALPWSLPSDACCQWVSRQAWRCSYDLSAVFDADLVPFVPCLCCPQVLL
jgi:hypothetical protein